MIGLRDIEKAVICKSIISKTVRMRASKSGVGEREKQRERERERESDRQKEEDKERDKDDISIYPSVSSSHHSTGRL